jgi:uncharacterized repeat protein (TIGR03803 family)
MTHHGRTTRNVILAAAATLMLAVFSVAQYKYSETVLYTFTGGKNGAIGGLNLVADSSGSLYGTTDDGGNKSAACEVYTGVPGCGVVFKLTRDAHGAWKETVLYTFTGGKDGAVPIGGVIRDSAGNLYGTTFFGGDTKPKVCRATGAVPGCGVVFKLTRDGDGAWKKTVLHTFTGGRDGLAPWDRLVLDSSGNLYGTTRNGGNNKSCLPPYGCGVVFKLTPTARGPWKESVLYAFSGGSAGLAPYAGVTFDSRGNLYGTTLYGGDTKVSCLGATGCGLVFKLTPTRKGPWKESVLYAFKAGTDGGFSYMSVILDSRGNVYGATNYGGDTTSSNCPGGYGFNAPAGCGVVFKLTPRAHGPWTETVLYAFTGGSDGGFADTSVYFDSSGNLYGMTSNGGNSAPCVFGNENNAGCGVVFKLTPTKTPPWTESVLYAFPGGTDGGEPQSNVLFDSTGNIFGFTSMGGNTSDCTGNFSGAGCGVVFELTP